MSKFNNQFEKGTYKEFKQVAIRVPIEIYDALWMRCPKRSMLTEVLSTFIQKFHVTVEKEIPNPYYELDNVRKYKDIISRIGVSGADGTRHDTDDGGGAEKICGRIEPSQQLSPDEQITEHPRE